MWLVGIDVESLYTSIPHSCGLQAVGTFLNTTYPESRPQNEFLVELLEFMLLNNFFQFLTIYYQQIPPWGQHGHHPKLASIWGCGRRGMYTLRHVPWSCTHVVAVHRWCFYDLEGYPCWVALVHERTQYELTQYTPNLYRGPDKIIFSWSADNLGKWSTLQFHIPKRNGRKYPPIRYKPSSPLGKKWYTSGAISAD